MRNPLPSLGWALACAVIALPAGLRAGPAASLAPDSVHAAEAVIDRPSGATVRAPARSSSASATSPRRRGETSGLAAEPGPVAVHIVSRVGGSRAPADTAPKRARADRGVTLHAVLEVGRGSARRFYSDAGRIRLAGRVHTALPLARAPAAMLRWYKVEPTTENLSNTATGRFRFAPVPYAETLVEAWSDRPSVAADVRPTRTADRGQGVGTMRYKLVAITAGRALATAGAGDRAARGGGLDHRVHRVSLRRGDDYLGMLTELFGQPYIWASGGRPDRYHQTERLEGADCADFVVYGARRLGRDIPYTWSEGLRAHTRRVGAGALRADGVYVDHRGAPLPFPHPGDLLLFPRHVGALSADRGVPGVLDREDLMMHTLFTSPREQPIADSGYAGQPVEIRRWP